MTAAPQRTRCETQYPWIIDGVDFHSCFILNYVNITSTFSDLSILLVSINSTHSSQLTNHLGNEHTRKVTMSNIIYWDEHSIHHLASLCTSSPTEVAPLSPRQISASLSLLDSEWQNLSVSIALECILLSKGQFASSKLSINRDTWGTCKSAGLELILVKAHSCLEAAFFQDSLDNIRNIPT